MAQGLKQDGLVDISSLPADGSGRNRPASVAGIPLAYDANGNLSSKGNLRFEYDFRNRLSRVTNDQGVEVAFYTYDAFNRRISRSVSGTMNETVWSGWRPVEEYQGGNLVRRRIYGSGLDEIVSEQADLDGDGAFETEYTPLYDSSGNLVALTGTDGRVFERYEYSSFGRRVGRVDATPPRIDQTLFRAGEIRFEFSETMDMAALQQALLDGRVRIEDTTSGEPIESEWVPPKINFGEGDPLALLRSAPPTGGLSSIEAASTVNPAAKGAAATGLLSTTLDYGSPQQIERVGLRPLTPPLPGTEVRLVVEASALVDIYGNVATVGVDQIFLWPSSETVLLDTAAPSVHAVRLRQSYLEIEFDEEPDLASVQTAVDVGQPVTWTLLADDYTVRSDLPLSTGVFTLTIGTGLQDLAGTALAPAFSLTAEVAGTGHNEELFEAPDPREISFSSVGNVFGFHGHPRDPETGLIYIRNRYYDPELGRFITADPMGYVDGPSMYEFGGYSPANFGDPLGLAKVGKSASQVHYEKAAEARRDLRFLLQWKVLKHNFTDRGYRNDVLTAAWDAVWHPFAGAISTPGTEFMVVNPLAMTSYLDDTARLAAVVDDLDTLAPKVSSGPLKNASGDLDEAAAAARTQPHHPMPPQGAEVGQGVPRGTGALSELRVEPKVVLSGGRGGEKVKTLLGPPNAAVRGGGQRVFVTNDKGQVILDITVDRVKPVIPGQGFGPKRAPTKEELDLLNKVLEGGGL